MRMFHNGSKTYWSSLCCLGMLLWWWDVALVCQMERRRWVAGGSVGAHSTTAPQSMHHGTIITANVARRCVARGGRGSGWQASPWIRLEPEQPEPRPRQLNFRRFELSFRPGNRPTSRGLRPPPTPLHKGGGA